MSEVSRELMGKINQALKQFGATPEVRDGEVTFAQGKIPQSIVDFYIKERNYFAFLLGVLYDQQSKAHVVWKIPYNLFNVLGHLNIKSISEMSYEDMHVLFNELPQKPRLPRDMAMWTIQAAKRILNEYDGRVENIWADNPCCADVQERFQRFDGIGQKKAAMATETLVKKYDIALRDRSGLDIAADDLVTRVFKRCGFVNYEDKKLVVSKARELNPDYPGVLDRPCWVIGGQYCSPINPTCVRCPISDICPKQI
jgi:endonuclease III